MKMKGDAYGGRLKGVNEDVVDATLVEGLDSESSEDSVLGSWRKRMAAGSTEIMSPGARRVLAFVC
jgi:hypothetical protein